MKDKTLKIMELIDQEKTCNEICQELNITNKLLFHYLTLLQNKGKYYKRKYYSDGEIIYNSINSVTELTKFLVQKNTTIITSPKETELKTLVISDLHLGNKLERLDLLEKAYNYCSNNNIHIIFCCGDIIDGSFSQEEQTIPNIDEQLEYLKKYFPTDSNILAFAVGGDHDYSSLLNAGQDMVTMLKNYRHDIIMNNYNNAFIEIKNDKLQLYHKNNGGSLIKTCAPIVFHGHYHQYKTSQEKDGTIHVTVPSLSNINQKMPSAIQSTFKFNKGYIDDIYLNQIYFGEHENVTLSEVQYHNILATTKLKQFLYAKINNEEERTKEKQLIR